MKRLSFILMITIFTIVFSSALAEQTLLTTIVPSEHTLNITFGDGGTVIVNGTTLTEGKTITIGRHERVVIEIIPNPESTLKTATISSDYGVSLQNNTITIAQMVQDMSVQIDFEPHSTPITYPVTVVNGTGSGNYAEGTTVTITADSPTTGKQFVGWTSSDDVMFADANAATTTFVMPAKDITVTAMYADVPVSVHYAMVFHANGGEGSMPNQYFNYGESKALMTNTFTREGFVFTGWNSKADGTGTAYADGQVVTMYGSAIFYAQWKAVELPVVPTPVPTPNPNVNPLLILKHPADQMVAPGETADFTVVATGDGLTYQWYINRNDGLGWVKLHGATSAVYETSAAELAHDGFQYACEVYDIHGNMARSNTAVLYVVPQPDIPETGDSTNLILLCAMLFISSAGYLLLAKNRKQASN